VPNPIDWIEGEAAAGIVGERARRKSGDDVIEPRVGARPAGTDLGLEQPAGLGSHGRRLGTLVDPAVPPPHSHGAMVPDRLGRGDATVPS
jgi:hypothetical protein